MKKRYRRTSLSQYLYLALFLVCLAGLGYLLSTVLQRVPFQDDFVIPWSAGRLWLLEGISPYDGEVTQLARATLDQSSFLGSLPAVAKLIDPAINLIFYLPFGLLPYEVSRVIWTTLLVLVVGLIGYFSFKLSGWRITLIEKIGIILFCILWLPGINVILRGQISPIIVLLILFCIFLLLNEKDTQAGFILALTLGSLPTTGLIILLLLIWGISRRRWSLLTTYFSGAAFLFAVTLLLLPSWLLDWLRIIFDSFSNWEWIQTPLMDLAKILPGIENALSIFFHAVLAIYLLVLWITLLGKTGRIFTWKVLAMLVVAYLFHVRPSISQLFLVMPALFLVFRFWSERWRLYGRLSSWIILILLLGGSWLLARPEIRFISEFSMPLLFVGLPVLVFTGMIWIRWWALQIPHLPFESQ